MKQFFTSRDIIFSLVYSILLIIPDSLWIDASEGRMPYEALLVYNFIFYLSLSLIICKITYGLKKLHKAIYYFVHSFMHLFFYGFSISSIFLYLFFNLKWDAYTFQLIHETNYRESSEFIYTFIFTHKCGILLLCYLLLERLINVGLRCHGMVPVCFSSYLYTMASSFVSRISALPAIMLKLTTLLSHVICFGNFTCQPNSMTLKKQTWISVPKAKRL